LPPQPGKVLPYNVESEEWITHSEDERDSVGDDEKGKQEPQMAIQNSSNNNYYIKKQKKKSSHNDIVSRYLDLLPHYINSVFCTAMNLYVDWK